MPGMYVVERGLVIARAQVMLYDVIIVGAGPAGLSAALILGRCRRKVLICDAGNPRNASSRKLHGFLTRDQISPADFLQISRKEVKAYPSVEFLSAEVNKINRLDGSFEVRFVEAEPQRAKKILLATGVVDELPALAGIEPLYGKSVFQCPYCDGWEVRETRIAAYGKADRGFKLAKTLTAWSKDLILFTDGPSELGDEQKAFLKNRGITLREEKIRELEGDAGRLVSVVLDDGRAIERDALFFNTPSYIRSELIEDLGCEFSNSEGVYTEKYACTKIPGVYAAGNILRDVQLAIVAAAEGARAAFGINCELTEEAAHG